MTVPPQFVGAWEREGLDIGGAVMPRIGHALWIEGGGTYVDVRAPGTVASGTSFGGRSAWQPPVFTWHHDLDLHPRPARIDRGELECVKDRIIERGVGIEGGTARYEERWRRLPGPQVAPTIARHECGLAVRVGDYAGAILVTPATATARAWRYSKGRWFATILLGSGRDLPEPNGSGWHRSRGWTVE